jgi:Enoyl-CoA hydratase/isomerase
MNREGPYYSFRPTMMMMRSIAAVGFPKVGRRWAAAAVATPPRCFLSTTKNVVVLKDSYEYIQVDRRANIGVGVIALHRPQALNALCDALFQDLLHATTALDQDDTIGCLVLTGSTPKAFAAGADIGEMKDRTFDFAYKTVCVCVV